MGRRDWDDAEIKATLDAYFRLLEAELADAPLQKSTENARVRETVNRSRGAVEFKFQNVSAVLRDLHVYWVEGYKPRGNYQGALRDAVIERLAADSRIEESMLKRLEEPLDERIAADIQWDLTSPPSIPMAPALDRKIRRAVKHDFVALEARRRDLGLAGEEAVVRWERERLERAGYPRLARRVRHVSVDEGDGLGYDILSFDPGGEERFIEVKTTRQGVEWPFLVSRNEVEFSSEEADRFSLYRVFDFGKAPRAGERRHLGLYVLPGSLERTCSLRPEVYQGLPR